MEILRKSESGEEYLGLYNTEKKRLCDLDESVLALQKK